MRMPIFLQQILGVIIRAGLLWVSGWLLARGWPGFSAETITNLVVALTPAIAGLLWSIWVHYRLRVKLLTSIATPSAGTEAQLNAAVKAGPAPSVLTKPTDIPQL